MCHLLFGMIHALSRPIHSQRHHLFCIIPQASPCFPSCASPHLTKRQKNWIRSTQPCMVNTSKGGRLPFLTICRLWAMSSHLCSQYHSIIAVCKMLLTAIWNILSKLVPYTPVGFLATPHAAAPSRTLTISQGFFSPAASWLYSCRRSCTSCTLNSDPVFRRLPDGLFPMPYLGLAVHTIVSNLCPFLFVVLQF